MRVLIVKTSSLGDIVHTFPALSDAIGQIPGIRFDWAVEQPFMALPLLHPAVDRVIPSAVRQWRRSWIRTWLAGDWKRFRQDLQFRCYDAVIDAQGLIKSALITSRARGPKHGYDRYCIRESYASRLYDHCHFVSQEMHAVERIRYLFSHVLEYSLEGLPLEYGLQSGSTSLRKRRSILLLHGATWSSKCWPLAFWAGLVRHISEAGYSPVILAGDDHEREFAQRICRDSEIACLLPPQSLLDIVRLLKADIRAFVSVDTGLAHLAASLDVPGVSLYGATDTRRTGVYGANQLNLQSIIACSPCFRRDCPKRQPSSDTPPCTLEIQPRQVWTKLVEMAAL